MLFRRRAIEEVGGKAKTLAGLAGRGFRIGPVLGQESCEGEREAVPPLQVEGLAERELLPHGRWQDRDGGARERAMQESRRAGRGLAGLDDGEKFPDDRMRLEAVLQAPLGAANDPRI